MIQVLKYYVNGREAEPINYSRLADEMRKWAKSENGTLNNSHVRTIIDSLSQRNLTLYTEKDILNFLKNDFDKRKLLNEELIKNYKEDYIRFIKN